MDFDTTESNKEVCFYCREYHILYDNYPLNIASHFDLNNLTPRCEFHWKYTCNFCNKDYHFNGISYCFECDQFTCMRLLVPLALL